MAKKKQNKRNNQRVFLVILSILTVLFLIAVGIKVFRISKEKNNELTAYDTRNIDLMSQHRDKIFGIDISQYQGKINWKKVKTINHIYPIDFVYVRATMGKNGFDKSFEKNWKAAKEHGFRRGVYHYYRPNENSDLQILNFIPKVSLEPGDLPPVLDIEDLPTTQSMENLKKGLKKWLDEIEKYYGVKPILYSSDKYYADLLQKDFPDHQVWIANYNFWVNDLKDHWLIWQFSEKGTVEGIDEKVDLNIFNGNLYDLENLTVKDTIY